MLINHSIKCKFIPFKPLDVLNRVRPILCLMNTSNVASRSWWQFTMKTVSTLCVNLLFVSGIFLFKLQFTPRYRKSQTQTSLTKFKAIKLSVMVWENDRTWIKFENNRQTKYREIALLKLAIWFIPPRMLATTVGRACRELLPLFNIKKRYCIHYYYNLTVIFTLKLSLLHPLPYAHVSFFYILHFTQN